jgi:hypothetical protein
MNALQSLENWGMQSNQVHDTRTFYEEIFSETVLDCPVSMQK